MDKSLCPPNHIPRPANPTPNSTPALRKFDIFEGEYGHLLNVFEFENVLENEKCSFQDFKNGKLCFIF